MSRKSNPKYRKQVTATGKAVAFVELSGRRIYLGDYGTPESRTRYKLELREWKARGRQPELKPEEILLVEVAACFMEYAKTHYRKPDGSGTSSMHKYRLALQPLIEMYGQTPATALPAVCPITSGPTTAVSSRPKPSAIG